MRLVSHRQDVLDALERCRCAGVALFAPNGELPAEIEGLCIGAQRFADENNIKELPIAIGMTGNYADNPQLRKISTPCRIAEDLSGFHGGDVRQGCEIWLRHLACYEDLLGYFPAIRLMPFIDHGWAVDAEDQRILFDESIIDRIAIMMYDASILDWQENIAKTRDYVERYGRRVVVEAACDRIYDPKEIKRLKLSRDDQLSDPEKVEQFVRQTGVDLIVPNLGTEHRSVGAGTVERRYERELTRHIRDRVGTILSLHGSSCLGGKVGSTPEDGIIKVNFYTAMAVDAGSRICNLMIRHQDKVIKDKNLWINSASYFHDVRRRVVADICYQMLDTLGYRKLANC